MIDPLPRHKKLPSHEQKKGYPTKLNREDLEDRKDIFGSSVLIVLARSCAGPGVRGDSRDLPDDAQLGVLLTSAIEVSDS